MTEWGKKSCTFNEDDLIGQGAFSKVYRSNKFTDGSTQTTAVKVYNKNRESEGIIIHAKRQQNMLKKIESQFVCSYRKSLESKNNFYMVQKLQQGTTLDKIIKQKKRLEPKQVTKVSKSILKGLEYLHSKCIMHRDLKPSNIIYNQDSDKAVLLDLGFATYFHKNDEKVLTSIVGTPNYMSPELLMGKKYNSLSDVWSFGCIVYEMLCGDVPFKGRNEKEILNSILTKSLSFKSNYCPTLEWLISNCLKIDTKERMSWQQLFLWMNKNILKSQGNKKSRRQKSETKIQKAPINSIKSIKFQQEKQETNCECTIF